MDNPCYRCGRPIEVEEEWRVSARTDQGDEEYPLCDECQDGLKAWFNANSNITALHEEMLETGRLFGNCDRWFEEKGSDWCSDTISRQVFEFYHEDLFRLGRGEVRKHRLIEFAEREIKALKAEFTKSNPSPTRS